MEFQTYHWLAVGVAFAVGMVWGHARGKVAAHREWDERCERCFEEGKSIPTRPSNA